MGHAGLLCRLAKALAGETIIADSNGHVLVPGQPPALVWRLIEIEHPHQTEVRPQHVRKLLFQGGNPPQRCHGWPGAEEVSGRVNMAGFTSDGAVLLCLKSSLKALEYGFYFPRLKLRRQDGEAVSINSL